MTKSLKYLLGGAFAVVVVMAGSALLLQTDIGQLLTGRWSFVKGVSVDRSTFFRLKVKLTYKGEPQDFDIVVGCNVRVIAYKYGGSTYEAGHVPVLYGRAMSDGKAVVVRTPNACGGETTANGWVRQGLLPVIVVYDDAKTLAFGTAYISDDAYKSPLSILGFGGATIEKATRAEFDQFRLNAPSNIVSRAQYHMTRHDPSGSYSNAPALHPPYPRMGRNCYAFERFRTPNYVQPLVRQMWPANRPKYWAAEPSFTSQFIGEITHRSLQRDTGGAIGEFSGTWPSESLAETGAATEARTSMIGPPQNLAYRPASYFPRTSDQADYLWPLDETKWPILIDKMRSRVISRLLLSGGATRGLAYCYTETGPKTVRLSSGEDVPRTPETYNNWMQIPEVIKVDDDLLQIPMNQNVNRYLGHLFFERDEFFYWPFQIDLGNLRGDV